jgi:hypothetical protein
MALALQQSGIPGDTVVAAALAFHAVETVSTLAFGSSDWAVLRFASGAGARTCSRPRSGSE